MPKVFREFILNPSLHVALKSYFGSSYYHLSAYQTHTVPPRSGGIYWRRDHPFRFIRNPRRASAIHLFFCLPDFSVETGSTIFYPSQDPESLMSNIIGQSQENFLFSADKSVTIEAPMGQLSPTTGHRFTQMDIITHRTTGIF